MALQDSVEDQDRRIKLLEKQLRDSSKKGKKKFSIKIPSKIVRAARRDGVFAALVLGAGHKAGFKEAKYSDGLIYVGGVPYAYEDAGVYHLKKGNKTIPLIVVYDWRLTLVGGETENHGTRVLNSGDDVKVADDLGIGNFGQLTILRAMEQARVIDSKKKMGGLAPIAWLFIGVGGIYLVSKLFGG